MARTVQSMLDERAAALVGRDRERAALLDLLDEGPPVVAMVHGIAGVGKSTLLQAAAVDARARGATVIALDGRTFEPTERGFLGALGDALAQGTGRVLLTIDSYERLGLLDAWLRQRFVPALPEHVRLLLAGRDAPLAWQRELGDLLRVVRLENLADDAARELLRRTGVEGDAARRIVQLAGGHPLSLQLAAGALAERPGLPADAAVLDRIVDELAEQYLAGLDAGTRRALDAASVVRRTTLTLLEAMLPGEDASELFERLRALPFVELGPDGLLLHDTVRTATSALLRAADPARHRAHRSAAWARLRAELRSAGRADLWRYTADMLYLVENPIIRDAFFPSGPDDLVTEPAGPGDRGAILALAADMLVRDWLDAVPETFVVVRDAAGSVRRVLLHRARPRRPARARAARPRRAGVRGAPAPRAGAAGAARAPASAPRRGRRGHAGEALAGDEAHLPRAAPAPAADVRPGRRPRRHPGGARPARLRGRGRRRGGDAAPQRLRPRLGGRLARRGRRPRAAGGRTRDRRRGWPHPPRGRRPAPPAAPAGHHGDAGGAAARGSGGISGPAAARTSSRWS